MGTPVMSQETRVGGGTSGNRISNGGPGIISDNAERAPRVLATAISLVPILRIDSVTPFPFLRSY